MQTGGRVLTTHTGKLPPTRLPESGATGDQFDITVAALVRRQCEIGLDVVNDGEAAKTSYVYYVVDRLTGLELQSATTPPSLPADLRDFPTFAERRMQGAGAPGKVMVCTGPIRVANSSAIERDLVRLRQAIERAERKPVEAFVTAASPGVLARFTEDRYYGREEDLLHAIAEAMRAEYEAIVAAGFILQLDCPDLAAGRSTRWADVELAEFRGIVGLHIEALNHATARIPPERVRMHVCWGNYEGPHHRDVPLRDIIDLLLTARPSGLSFEAANPRHAHEWQVFEGLRLPEGKVLIPGVIDSTTNYIEHPELVAQRIRRFVDVVGQEHVMAGVDCGFSAPGGVPLVDPEIAWAKLGALVEGARLAAR